MLWYIQHKDFNTPVPVEVCNRCGRGSFPFFGSAVYASYPNFTSGRIIADAQPRFPGTCPDCM